VRRRVPRRPQRNLASERSFADNEGKREIVVATTESNAGVSKRETGALIGSDKVEGTAVRKSTGEKIGEIERVMIDKRSGRVAYAVMSFGGFLGIGEDYYPIPWEKLRYNTELDAYELDVEADRLRGAPSYPIDRADWGRMEDARIYNYWGVDPYWTL
jgi:sporulation protein YlmC with PRC-barrel domain